MSCKPADCARCAWQVRNDTVMIMIWCGTLTDVAFMTAALFALPAGWLCAKCSICNCCCGVWIACVAVRLAPSKANCLWLNAGKKKKKRGGAKTIRQALCHFAFPSPPSSSFLIYFNKPTVSCPIPANHIGPHTLFQPKVRIVTVA